jgi:hypothetical protein
MGPSGRGNPGRRHVINLQATGVTELPMPDDRFDSAGQRALRYRERAAEMRRQAVGVANEQLRYILLENVKLYDALAGQAERNSEANTEKGNQDDQRN